MIIIKNSKQQIFKEGGSTCHLKLHGPLYITLDTPTNSWALP
jgi:hypothetical protein